MKGITKEQLKYLTIRYSEKIGVKEKITSIQVRNMKNKLASCSSKGRITFNSCVLDMDMKEIKHIIIHELLHLRYKNHSKMFKIMMRYYIDEDE